MSDITLGSILWTRGTQALTKEGKKEARQGLGFSIGGIALTAASITAFVLSIILAPHINSPAPILTSLGGLTVGTGLMYFGAFILGMERQLTDAEKKLFLSQEGQQELQTFAETRRV